MPTRRRNRQNRRSSQRGGEGWFDFLKGTFSPSTVVQKPVVPTNVTSSTAVVQKPVVPTNVTSSTAVVPTSATMVDPNAMVDSSTMVDPNATSTTGVPSSPRKRNDDEVYTGVKNETGKLTGGKSKKRRSNKKKRSNKKR